MKQQVMEYLKRKVRPSCSPNSVLVGLICFFSPSWFWSCAARSRQQDFRAIWTGSTLQDHIRGIQTWVLRYSSILCNDVLSLDLVRITVHLFKRLFPQFCCAEAEASKSNFLALVQTLIQDPVEREHFFQVSICFFKQQSLNISMVRQHWYNKTDETSSI